jgi:putative cell wall-binding protein
VPVQSPSPFRTSAIHPYSASGTYTVTLKLTDYIGRTASTTQQVTVNLPSPGQPSPPPTTIPTVHRIGGSDRYATGRLVSQAAWTAGTADSVVLARGDAAPDALAGVPLAARVHGPLLLSDPSGLDPATRAEIDRVLGGPQSKKTVYLLGGPAALSPAIAESLHKAGYTVVRYGGASRFDTALQIADSFGPTGHVVVATGRDFPDALAAGPFAAAEGAPIVLSDGPALDPVSAAFISGHTVVDPVGGQAQRAVAALASATRSITPGLAGADRYATAADVATQLIWMNSQAPSAFAVASGTVFPDALTGGALAAKNGTPLLMTDPAQLSDATVSAITQYANNLHTITLFGGESAISPSVETQILNAVHGRLG